jgi:hypothetical protein
MTNTEQSPDDSRPAVACQVQRTVRPGSEALPQFEPVTLADVLDALNLFNRPKPSEDNGPWEGGHFIRVDHLPDFINIIAAAWFARPKPLTDEQLSRLVLQTVYEGDDSTPYRDAWAAEIGIPFARAVERKHGIRA